MGALRFGSTLSISDAASDDWAESCSLATLFSIMLTKPFSDLDEDTCWLLLGGGAPFEVVYFLKQIEVGINHSY